MLAHFGIERLRQEHERQSEAAAVRAGGSAKLAEAFVAAGLHPGQHIGIHDGGPVYEAHLAALGGG